MLQTILNPGEASWKTIDTRRPGQQNDPNLTKDSITDSSPSRNSTSFANFDFHGLAQTQTQCFDEDVGINEGSQKENIESTREELLMTMPSTSHATPASIGGAKVELVTAKTVSFQSPQKRLASPQTINNPSQRYPTRSTTLPRTIDASAKHIASPIVSQDSFGVLDQDPDQQFLATSKHFNIPLSELPRVVLTAAAASSSRQSPEYSTNRPLRRYRRSPSPTEGTILVESTPSASGGSQSQPSQLYPEGQPESPSDLPEPDPDIPMADIEDTRQAIEDCYSSDAPSNMYDEYSLPSTALDATQPSTQVEDDHSMDGDQVHPFDAPVPHSTRNTGTIESSLATNPRGMLTMVDPKKLHRYIHLVQKSPPENPPTHGQPLTSNVPPSSVLQSTAPSSPLQVPSDAFVATQPSLEEEPPQPAQRRLPGRTKPSSDTPILPYRRYGGVSRPQEVEGDGMDIVPDSEPQNDAEVDLASRSPCNQSPSSGPTPLNFVKGDKAQNSLLEVANTLFPDDDDDDVPLSAIVPHKDAKSLLLNSKGKGRAFYENDDLTKSSGFLQTVSNRQGTTPAPTPAPDPAPPPLDLAAPTSNVRTTRASTALLVDRSSRVVRSWPHDIVPSSLPGEDAGKARGQSRDNAVPPKKSRAKGKAAISQACPRQKRTAAAPAKRTRKRAETTAEESPLSASDDQLLLQKGRGDEDDSTESADDVHVDPDFVGPSSRKRKRSAPPAKTIQTEPKSSKKMKKAASSTPSVRQVKRLRSATSTAGRISNWTGTRVFALWRSDSCYYAGTVDTDYNDGTYAVSFDDNSKAIVNVNQMRSFDLRVNDDVMLPDSVYGYKVVAVDNLDSSQVVSVRIDTVIKEIKLRLLRIASKTIDATWQDRTLARHMVTAAEVVKASPAPSGQSTATVPSRRPGRSSIFEKTAFVVSVSSGEGNWERERESLMSAIQNNGGVIVNDWSDVIDLKGEYSDYNNQWVITKKKAKWIGAGGIERMFLLADQPSFKAKFLIALALGIPCLEVAWLHDSVSASEEKDWRAYMLSQGHSEELSARISQQVDFDWGTSVHHLGHIMDNKIPCKLLDGKSILCVGDTVPKMRLKKRTCVEEKAYEAHNALTRIILAMGADRVEAVSEVTYASAPLPEFDFVVIKKPEHYSPSSGMVPDKTVLWTWVKDCLIASRLLRHKEWQAESQDA
ncbi:hypothetical protein C0991_003900 [Blastosporella zonata]|nr:hypothetical protein C0991_003900 [Blastosporella zonata]